MQELAVGTLSDLISLRDNHNNFLFEKIILIMQGHIFSGLHLFDSKTEWVIIKGIKDFIDDRQSSSEKWEEVASLMAASVVAKILSDPDIFQDWPHSNAGIASCLNLSFIFTGTDLILICLHFYIFVLLLCLLNKTPLEEPFIFSATFLGRKLWVHWRMQ